MTTTVRHILAAICVAAEFPAAASPASAGLVLKAAPQTAASNNEKEKSMSTTDVTSPRTNPRSRHSRRLITKGSNMPSDFTSKGAAALVTGMRRMTPLVLLLAAPIVLATALIASVGVAFAQPASATLTPPPLRATVTAAGGLVKGTSVLASRRLGSGRFEVTFNRDVRSCTYTATIGDPGSALVYYPGLVFTAGGHQSANGVYVETKNLGGGLSDLPFHLDVNCGNDLRAVVTTAGQVRGSASSVTRLGVGRYEVRFSHNVRGCTYTATIGDPGSALVYYPGLVFTAGGHLSTNGVYVETKNLGGGLSDYPFHLNVRCYVDPYGQSDRRAVVTSTGALNRGLGVQTVHKLGTGRYEVWFTRDVRSCTYTATIGDPGNGLVYSPGLVFTAGGHYSTNGVYVETKNLGGGLSDFPFHLYVAC